MISFFDRAETIVGKEENAGYQHFLLLPRCFETLSVLRLLKVGIVWERVIDKICTFCLYKFKDT